MNNKWGERTIQMIPWVIVLVTFSIAGWLFYINVEPIGTALMALGSATLGSTLTVSAQHHQAKLNRQHELKLAALDKRLEAHQEAYTLWWSLIGHVFNEDMIDTSVSECQEWWTKNCLFLSSEASVAFRQAFLAARHHRLFVDHKQPDELIKNNWADIETAGNIIAVSAGLPAFGATPNNIGSSKN